MTSNMQNESVQPFNPNTATPGQRYSAGGGEHIYIGPGTPKSPGEPIDYWFCEMTNQALSEIGSHENLTTSPDDYRVTVSEGSEIGFEESVGMRASVSGGLPFGIAEFEVEVSGEISFSQALTKSTTREVGVEVAANQTVVVYEAQLAVQYFLCRKVGAGSWKGFLFSPSKLDVINTGATVSKSIATQRPGSAD